LLQGGNDYEIYSHGEVKGHTTTGPDDTVAQCRALFLS
jgi:phosphomannomutase